MQGHQPPETLPRCPSWCIGKHDFSVHGSESHEHGGINVRLLQSFLAPEARIYISAGDIPVSEAPNWAHTFAMLGQPELAATVKRLGELAEADAMPQPAAAAAEITRLTEGWDKPADVAQPSDLPDGTDLSGLAVKHISCTIGRRGGYVNPSTGAIVWSRLLEDQPAVSHG